jgi:hypothetical protein
MIVENAGYLNYDQVHKLREDKVNFCIYKTTKNTHILIIEPDTNGDNITLYNVKKDRLPYKVVEGKKIISGVKIFDSKSINGLETIGWNNGNQIMSYKSYDYSF